MALPAKKMARLQPASVRKSGKRREKPAPIESLLVAALTSLKEAYAQDIDALMRQFLPRLRAREFGRDLGVIGEVFEYDKHGEFEDSLSPATEAMERLGEALERVAWEQEETFGFLAMACSRYRDEAPENRGEYFVFCVARDIRDAYLAFVDRRLSVVSEGRS